MDIDTIFEEQVREIDSRDVIVLRNIPRFPVYGKGFVSPNMTISINTSGTGKALYDLHEVQFEKNDLAVVLPNHLLSPISSSPDYQVTMVVVSPGFIKDMKKRTLTHDYAKFHLAPACHISNEQKEKFLKIVDALEVISLTSEDELPHRHELLIYQLDILLELLHSFRHEQDKSRWEPRERVVFNDFCDLLAIHHRETHSVADYAAYLHISPKYFSSLIQKAIGVTAGEWIDQYLVTQIKKVLLSRNDLSIQQVSFEFGFEESASFCRFFKNNTGMTPTQFRTQGKMVN